MPSVLATFIALFGLFPIGSFLPDLSILSLFGFLLTILFLAVLTPAFGIVAAGALDSWLPLGIGFVAMVGLVLGTLPGVGVYVAIEEMALKSAASRSSRLVQAILAYERTYHRPPESLNVLVPMFLAEVPSTGMAAHPQFSYAANAGPCSKGNSWRLLVPLTGFDVDLLIYCPQQDYDALERDSLTEISRVGEWTRSSFSD